MTSPSQKNQWAELFDAARPLEERTALAFAADGPLARRQTNFTPREGQLAFAQAVAEAIQNILRREHYPQPYETLKALTRTNEKMNEKVIHDFIDKLDVSEAVKKELKAIRPENYTGLELI